MNWTMERAAGYMPNPTDTITAQAARSLTERACQISCDRFYEAISKAASNGDSNCRFSLSDREKKLVTKIETELKGRGFTTKIESGYDQRDNDSWYYLDVSW